MTRARIQQSWNHTSALMAHIANCHRDPKKRPSPYQDRDFHPCPPPRIQEQAIEAPITALAIFCR